MSYKSAIAEVVTDVEPRIIEAYMRLTFGTLDALSKTDFDRAARIARDDALAAGPDEAESLAASMGFGKELDRAR